LRINICLRTTINIDDKLLAKAQRYTGEKEETKLVHVGLRSLMQDHVATHLITLGGSDPMLRQPASRYPEIKTKLLADSPVWINHLQDRELWGRWGGYSVT